MDIGGLAKALAGEAQNRGAVEDAVDGGDGLAVGGEEAGPFGEADISGDDDRSLTMSSAHDAVEVVGMLTVETL